MADHGGMPRASLTEGKVVVEAVDTTFADDAIR